MEEFRNAYRILVENTLLQPDDQPELITPARQLVKAGGRHDADDKEEEDVD